MDTEHKERKLMSDNIVDAEVAYWEEHDRRLARGWPAKPDPEAISYNSKLVGVTFEGRQEVIKVLTGNERLAVRREADNKYDKNAVAVDVQFGEAWVPIGYIAKDKNANIAKALDAGNEVLIGIASLTGGGDKSYGVNVAVEYVKAKAGAKATKEAETPQKAPQELPEGVVSELGLLDNIRKLLGVEAKTEKYSSRLIGKVTEVTVTNGHVTVPGYMSGSKFPEKFYPEFAKDEFVSKILDKYYEGASEEQLKHVKESILDMWSLNGKASTSYGDAIHIALQNYDTYHALGDKTKKVETFKTKPDRVGPNKALSSNPFLKKVVEDFHEKFGGDYVRLSEQFIWLHEKQLCGAIDRVKVIDADKKIIRIQDFKTNANIHETKYQNADSPFRGVGKKALKEGKKEKPNTVEDTLLGLYWLQLSFYAYILKHYGYTVEGLDVYWLNPEKLAKGENAWEEFSHDVINIEEEV